MANAFGRVLNVAGGLAPRGGPVPINLPGYPAVYPSIAPESLANAQEYSMFQSPPIHQPPVVPIFTRLATGGCVPICACEINAAGQVLWTYLVHAHGVNYPINVAAAAVNPVDVYICMNIYSTTHSLWAARHQQGGFFATLDPMNVIPNANALLIYSDHSELVLTKQGRVAISIE